MFDTRGGTTIFHFKCTDLISHNEQTSSSSSIVTSRAPYRRNRHYSTKCPQLSDFIFPENTSFPAQPTSKRLSPSSYSTPLPPPLLSLVEFVVHRSITHAITSICGHTSETSSRSIPQNVTESRRMPNLAGVYYFILARLGR